MAKNFYVYYDRPGLEVLAYAGRSKKQAVSAANFRAACGYRARVLSGKRKPVLVQEVEIKY